MVLGGQRRAHSRQDRDTFLANSNERDRTLKVSDNSEGGTSQAQSSNRMSPQDTEDIGQTRSF